MRKRTRLVSLIKNILFVIFLLIFLFQLTILCSIIRETDEISSTPVLLFEVLSDSMYPVCKTGDGVLEVRTPFEELKTGDLITFRQTGEVVTHEIMTVNGDGTVTTWSIATGLADAPVSADDYIGRSILVIPKLSVFLGMIVGPIRKIAWIALILFVMFGPDLIMKLIERSKEKKNTKQPETQEIEAQENRKDEETDS